MSDYILELKNIVKRFPGVTALNGVNFNIKKGEIHALMGENGAGKSTLIKVITGVHLPDEGQIFLNGQEVLFKNTQESYAAGIAAVYQHSTAYPHLCVTENIFIGHEKLNMLGLVNWSPMHKHAKELLSNLGSTIDPRTLMRNLSVAEQQIVEISKAVSSNAEIIIMDEPTAALSERECEELYRIVDQLRKEGKAILFISHRLEDMYRLADRVTVFRDASYIGTWNIADVNNDILVKAMVGREIKELYPKLPPKFGNVALDVRNLSKKGHFRNISFSVRRGEVFGLTGLVGAGRSEVSQAICGITRFDSGEVILNEDHNEFTHPAQSMKKKMGYLPEDRQKQALFLPWEIYRNQSISTLKRYKIHGRIDKKAECRDSEMLSKKFSIKIQSIYDKVNSLSGGNQQKVVLSKLLNANLDIIFLDEPTKGVDVGAKSQIYEIISDLTQRGYAIVLISSEMPEVLAMSDRIGIMHEGSLVKIFEKQEATQEKMLAYAMGSDEVIINGEVRTHE